LRFVFSCSEYSHRLSKIATFLITDFLQLERITSQTKPTC